MGGTPAPDSKKNASQSPFLIGGYAEERSTRRRKNAIAAKTIIWLRQKKLQGATHIAPRTQREYRWPPFGFRFFSFAWCRAQLGGNAFSGKGRASNLS